jgi:hypothetical protein
LLKHGDWGAPGITPVILFAMPSAWTGIGKYQFMITRKKTGPDLITPPSAPL